METPAHPCVVPAEMWMCVPPALQHLLYVGTGFPWTLHRISQCPAEILTAFGNLRLHKMPEKHPFQQKNLWFLQPDSVLLSHRRISERREGSSGSQKIYSCFCWMTSSFLSHWPQPNIGEFKSFLSHPALDHIPVSLGLWSSSQLLVVALLFLLFTITSFLHGEPSSAALPAGFQCILVRKTPLFFW